MLRHLYHDGRLLLVHASSIFIARKQKKNRGGFLRMEREGGGGI